MCNLPLAETIGRKDTITMLIEPPGTQISSIDYHNMPSKQIFLNDGWKEVIIGTAAKQEVTAIYGFKSIRIKYTLRHVREKTINKAQGQTLVDGIAVDVTK